MSELDSIICRELPVVLQIIRDETWLEGERRGCPVPASDRVVRDNVCSVVLRVGAHLRESAAAAPAELTQCPVASRAP